MATCAILGAGSWAIAVAGLLDGNGHTVRLWEFDPAEAERLRTTRQQPQKLPGIRLPESVLVSNVPAEVLREAHVVLLALPSHIIREVARRLRDLIPRDALVVNLAKGLEIEPLFRMSEVLRSELPAALQKKIVTLSGPSHAEEVSRQMPTSVVVAGTSPEAVQKTQELFANNFFRVYTNADLIGVELAGSLKNIIAIAAGMVDGLGFGDNTKGALLTRGLAEITRLGEKMGAKPATFAGLAGLGDLVTTCLSRHSRNRYVGEQIGKGKTLQQVLAGMVMVAEGVKTTEAAYRLARRHGVEMPITEQVHCVLFENKSPRAAVQDLMTRTLKAEVWT